jgi:N-acetylmuramoyl-L-alanine amidase
MKAIYKQLPKHHTKRYSARDLTKVDMIVLHHCGVNAKRPEAGWHVYIHNVARYHVNNNGWPAIGYHYMVDPDGGTWKVNPCKLRTYHAKGGNTHTIGICLIGNFTKQSPGEVQLQAARELIADIRRAMPGINYVIGHRDVHGSSTSCPGKAFKDETIKELQEETR